MARNLIIDIGNTRSKLAVFVDQKLEKHIYIPKQDLSEKSLLTTVHEEGISGIFIASTGEYSGLANLQEIDKVPVSWMNKDTQYPIRLTYNTPQTLGQDRIAVMVACRHFAYNKNYSHYRYLPDYALVVDAGTAITYDVLHRAGVHMGGMISPGQQMRLDAMHHFTDRLPLVRENTHVQFLGDTTISSIASGAFHGLIAEVKGIIGQCEQQYGDILVMMTGGNALEISKHFDQKIFIEQNLVLYGLNEIYRFNDKNK